MNLEKIFNACTLFFNLIFCRRNSSTVRLAEKNLVSDPIDKLEKPAPIIHELLVEDSRVSIGKGTYASSPPVLRAHHAKNRIIIGCYCSIAHNVSIFAGGDHPMRYLTTHPLKLYFGGSSFEEWSSDCGDDNEVTVIGNDVWIGDGATVLSGVKVGDGAVLGARTVVANDVPPYAVVVGNPARVIKKRFNQTQIDLLLQLQWWNWSEEKVKRATQYLCSDNLDELLIFAKQNENTN